MEVIEHAADPRLVDYRDLRDQKARRQIEGDEFFIAEGPVALQRLLDSDHEVRSVLISDRKAKRFADFLETHADRIPRLFVVARDVMAEVVGFDLHRGVIAAANRKPPPNIGDLLADSRRLVLLEGINDAENTGLILRSASALHIDAMIIDPTGFDPYNRRSVRVSMGEALHVATYRANHQEWPDTLLAQLAAAGFEIWAMTPAADATNIWQRPLPTKLAVMFGAEGPGLQRHTMAAATDRVVLPIAAAVDSLNVAAAAAITFAIINREHQR